VNAGAFSGRLWQDGDETGPMKIHIASTEREIAACFPAISILRPHLAEGEFVGRVRHQQEAGYRLIHTRHEGMVAAAAGYRILDFLAWGRVLYVDDLVTLPQFRGRGHGGALLDWMIAEAGEAGCDALHLDSGHGRHDAHRMYLNKGMRIGSHHFSLELAKGGALKEEGKGIGWADEDGG
jgi:GNAT superfamily N-acetyltransferase